MNRCSSDDGYDGCLLMMNDDDMMIRVMMVIW